MQRPSLKGIIDPFMGVDRESRADFLVIGGGAAGLRAAIDLAAAGSVLLLSKRDPFQSSTQHAHSHVALALGEEEDVTLRLREILHSGDGLCCEEAARILMEEGPREVRRLTEWGARLE
ncbi:MAG: FAD-dependent oxidoreductase, partial [Terriglobia bacterium]